MSAEFEIWGVNDPNISAQLALAVELDLFRKEAGLDVSCTFIESGTTMADDLLAAEHTPFAFAQTPITALVLHDRGFSTKILAPLADIGGTQQVIVNTSRGIVQPEDLEGKRIGMAKGAAVYIALVHMAKDCNVEFDRLEFVHLLPHEQLAAFKDHTIDAIACWEPWTTKAQKMGGCFYFSGTRSEIPGIEGDISWLINQSCFIVPDAHLEAQPDVAAVLLKVLNTATRMLSEDGKYASKLLANAFQMSRLEILAAMQKNYYSMMLDNRFRLGLLGFRDFLHERGTIAAEFPENQLYDSSVLRHIDPALVRLHDKNAQGVKVIERAGISYREDISLVCDQASLSFLLADDSRFVRASLAKMVGIIGGEVVGQAATGREAIDKFKALQPDFITMDLTMPDVSGMDAIQQILRIDPDANIIVISASAQKEMREEIFNLGAKIFITKPFDPMLVAEIVGLLLL